MDNKVYEGDQYGCQEFLKESFLPAKNLKIGAKVICLCSRLSGSYDSWLQKTTKNHGWVKIEGIISDIKENGKRVVTLDSDQVNEWKKPIGKERLESYIAGTGYSVDHIIEYKGY